MYAYPRSSAACAQSRIFAGSVPISSEGKKALGFMAAFQIGCSFEIEQQGRIAEEQFSPPAHLVRGERFHESLHSGAPRRQACAACVNLAACGEPGIQYSSAGGYIPGSWPTQVGCCR